MAIAYVLINCDLGYEEQIIEELKHISDVKEMHGTFSAYDILAKVESANIENSILILYVILNKSLKLDVFENCWFI